ncbi:hypothetical protein [Candidatus Nitrotoga arctica]|uniref:Uncharacterized protein n=1 Tax=Candidatus Nitrotoga arctica TaxID=453162 RepID=A0ABN8AIA4_9PROT|nr:hypothetical protein [Candidatus Nitrotoga arctica]CAG9931541.1 protein of unknown function [Candidatus Nitrotoga arctica]
MSNATIKNSKKFVNGNTQEFINTEFIKIQEYIKKKIDSQASRFEDALIHYGYVEADIVESAVITIEKGMTKQDFNDAFMRWVHQDELRALLCVSHSMHNRSKKRFQSRDLSSALISLDCADAFFELARVEKTPAQREELKESIFRDARKEMSSRGAMARLANDPRQTAKKYVKDCWLVWQEEPERYKGKTDFATEMLKQEQCRSLKSQVKITGWCREWEKSHSAG